MTPTTTIITITEKLRAQTISSQELEQLKAWLAGDEAANERTEWLHSYLHPETAEDLVEMPEPQSPQWEYIIKEITRVDQGARIRKMPARRNFLKYAAAILIILGTAAYFWNTQQKENRQADLSADLSAEVRSTKADVAPGGNRAVLTLADGSKIILDSAANGKIATQNNATITKNGDRVIYQSPGSGSLSTLTYNTMTTPRGGQYQLTLPDGSQVWLNAESSITYPTAFTGNKREVTVTGEVYFEVTKDALKPFIVQCKRPGHPERSEGSTEQPLTIEVLGTHFNVNAYNEEPIIKTTLLEGSVKLTRSNNTNAVLTSLTLKPGQQGQLTNDQKLSLAVKPDIEQVMAWKNGVFDFNNITLKEAMVQLARWYDVEVVYEGTVPKVTFAGTMGRDLNLSQVLKGLSMMGVKYRIEGKRLIVTS